jgi:hypothetical protein
MTGDRKKIVQLALPFRKPKCSHRSRFISHACVPAGEVCFHCRVLLMQYIPDPPERLGYMSGTWAWKHQNGNEWTTFEWTAEQADDLMRI